MSPGCSSAKNTAWLAWAPECGCTLAKLQSNSCLARSMAKVFGHVDEFAAAVIAPARIAFGVFVGQHRPCASSTARETMFSDAISSI